MSKKSYYFLLGILGAHFADLRPFWQSYLAIAICLAVADLLTWALDDELNAAGQWLLRHVRAGG